ncbi:alpha/beta hydrolase [Devosia sp. LjRoot16]|uniref:alpha/beta fold hydrolase n=1 Tax=Devosia sp. LjRoot16 TaxID=3342271 RepID=UPI003ECF3A49
MSNRSFVLVATVVGALALPIPGTLAETAMQSPENHTAGDVSMTNHTRSATLKVPGATLYYEVQGSGPTLLIIPGGPQDAGVFAELSQRLADRYTVVAYDPRGNSRSTFDGEIKPLLMDQQADDAAALIEALGNGPAYVFGTSGGAQIGLNLAARHPKLVQALVAHEPPSMMLMDDPSEAVAADKALYDTYVKDGVDAAMGMFFSMNGLEEAGDATEAPPEFEMPPEEAETFARVSGNFEYWLAHGMLPLSLYTPDVATLKAGSPKIVVAIGVASAGQPIEEMSLALTNTLGIAPTKFPGDHMGFGPQAAAFADALHSSFAN